MWYCEKGSNTGNHRILFAYLSKHCPEYPLWKVVWFNSIKQIVELYTAMDKLDGVCLLVIELT